MRQSASTTPGPSWTRCKTDFPTSTRLQPSLVYLISLLKYTSIKQTFPKLHWSAILHCVGKKDQGPPAPLEQWQTQTPPPPMVTNPIKSVFQLHQVLNLFLNLTHKAQISTWVIFSFLTYLENSCLFPPSEIISSFT